LTICSPRYETSQCTLIEAASARPRWTPTSPPDQGGSAARSGFDDVNDPVPPAPAKLRGGIGAHVELRRGALDALDDDLAWPCVSSESTGAVVSTPDK
jgi:hypothetical protein